MKKAAVIGNPVTHSLSPALHGFWFNEYSVVAEYQAIQLDPAELDTFLDSIRAGEFLGANVTLPFKEDVFKKMDDLDSAAKATGAVNTIVAGTGGRLLGRNTDPEGFLENLKHEVPGFDPAKTRALVLGAGGAARAVVYGLISASVPKITVTGRSEKPVTALLNFFSTPNLTGASWSDKNRLAAESNLIINATPLGMEGVEDVALNLDETPKNTLVYDLVYTPRKTGLLRAAEKAGLKAIGGLGMLIFQAIPAFETWFGIRPEVDANTYAMLARRINHKDR
ncbi:MAG: shikimate dehydrogenase [Sphingomonadales bacterium]